MNPVLTVDWELVAGVGTSHAFDFARSQVRQANLAAERREAKPDFGRLLLRAHGPVCCKS